MKVEYLHPGKTAEMDLLATLYQYPEIEKQSEKQKIKGQQETN